MTKLESAKEIIKQNGACYAINCNDCIKNKEGINPCEYAESLALCDSEKYFKDKVNFCKEWLKENKMKFKVGDVVRWNGSEKDSRYGCGLRMNTTMRDFLKDKKPHTICSVSTIGSLRFKDDDSKFFFDPNWFEKVEEPIFEICEKYIVTDYEGNLEDEAYCDDKAHQNILVAYLPNTKFPFICVRKEDEERYDKGEKIYTVNWKYAKPIPEKKYKACSEASFEWIGKKVVDNFGTVSTIKMVGKDCVNFKQNDKEETCYDLFKRYTWLDGSVCGELDKE